MPISSKSGPGGVVRGAAWMLAFRALDRVLGIVSILILTRLLVPEDFGIVAMATAIIAFIDLFGSFNVDLALINRREVGATHLNTAWTLNLLAGCGIGMFVLLLSYPASLFYSEPRLVTLMSVLAVTPVLQGAENIGVVFFRKELNFALEFRYLLLKRMITFLSVIPLAFLLRNYWALILGILIGRAASLGLSFAMHPYRPRFALSERRDLLGFSGLMVLNNLIGFFKVRTPDLIVGRMLGPGALGIFNMGTELATMVTTEVAAPINRALLPNFSAMQGDEYRLRTTYLTVLGMTAVLVFPAAAGLAAVAERLVTVALGDRWLDAIPILQIMAAYGAVSALHTLGYTALIATNRPGAMIKVNAAQVLCMGGFGVWALSAGGIQALALAFLLLAVLFVPINFEQVRRQLKFQHRQVLKVLLRPLLSALLMGAVVMLFDRYIGQQSAGIAMLLAEVGLGAVVYILLVWSIWILFGRPMGGEQLLIESLLGQLRQRGWIR